MLNPHIFRFAFFALLVYAVFAGGYILRSNFALEQPPIIVEKGTQEDTPHTTRDAPQNQDTPTKDMPDGTLFVASMTSSKYHLPWCSGAKRIAEKNKVFFKTRGEAEAAGYSAAENCKDILLFPQK